VVFRGVRAEVPTLWDAARAAGLTTAGVSWPVTVGAPIDYLLPETNQAPRDTTWLDLMRQQSTPGLVDAVVERLGGFEPNANRDYAQRDRFSTAAAAVILERHKPNLLLVHLVEADGAQHQHGPGLARGARGPGRVDAALGALSSRSSGGHRARDRHHRHRRPRVLPGSQRVSAERRAARGGAAPGGRGGAITSWQAMAHRSAIRLKDPSDAALAQRVEALFGISRDRPLPRASSGWWTAPRSRVAAAIPTRCCFSSRAKATRRPPARRESSWSRATTRRPRLRARRTRHAHWAGPGRRRDRARRGDAAGAADRYRADHRAPAGIRCRRRRGRRWWASSSVGGHREAGRWHGATATAGGRRKCGYEGGQDARPGHRQ
jgi:hypothetical protein